MHEMILITAGQRGEHTHYLVTFSVCQNVSFSFNWMDEKGQLFISYFTKYFTNSKMFFEIGFKYIEGTIHLVFQGVLEAGGLK